MARVKINFPVEKPLYTCFITVRISDINYGNHLGNDAVLSIIHEARMQLLAKWNYTEFNAGGNSLIMGDVMIAYRGEAFYGETLQIEIFAEEITERSFDLLYRMVTKRNDVDIEIAHVKTGMICFDYNIRKISLLTKTLKYHLQGMDL